MKKPSWLWAPSYLPINHLLTPHSHRSPPLGSKVSDPVKIPLFLFSPSLLSSIVSLPPPTVYLSEPPTPFFTISLVCHFPYLCFTMLGIHFSITFSFCLSLSPFSAFLSQLSPSCSLLQLCTSTHRLLYYSLSFSHSTSYILVLLLLQVERVKEQRRQTGW